jgi:nucleoside-diphosphate-sugar epimerase
MQILITGATGFIGQHLVQRLVAQGQAVTLLLREQYASERPLPPALAALRPQLDIVYADLGNFNLTVQAAQTARPDRVIHLAAVGATDPFLPLETALRHNVHATLNLIRACCEKWRVAQALIARTPGERNGLNMYAASKAAAWQFVRMYARTQGWPLAGAMIFQAYGPGQPERALIPAALAAARRGDDFPMTGGQQRRDWIAVEDVARGLTAVSQTNLPPGTTVELGGGRLTSLLDTAKLIYQLVNKGGQPRPGLLPDRPGEAAPGKAAPRQAATDAAADVEKTAALTGWRAEIGLTEGLAALVQGVEND